jgi:hypothetical protein
MFWWCKDVNIFLNDEFLLKIIKSHLPGLQNHRVLPALRIPTA